MATATLTSKGQVTIPLSVRERLKLKAGDQVDFSVGADGLVTLRPGRIPFEQLLGALRSGRRRAASIPEMDRGIEKAVRDRWKRRNRRSRG